MKRSELAFALLLVPLDGLALLAAFSAAYFTRLQSGIIFVWDFPTFMRFVIAFIPIWLLLFALQGLYRIKWSKKLADETARVFLAVSSAMMLVVAWIFLSRTEFFSRLVVIYAWIYAIFFIIALRIFLRALQIYLLKKHIGIHRVIVIGDNGIAKTFVANLQRDVSFGLKLLKIIPKSDINKLDKLQILKQTDEIILADPSLAESEILKLIEFCEQKHLTFRMIPNLFKVHAINVDVSYFFGIPILEFKKSPLDGWWRTLKRGFDIIAAFISLILTFPVLLLTACAIKLNSPGPIVYKNRRVGPNGEFDAYKFRSMFLQYCTGIDYGGQAALKYEKKLIALHNTRKGGIYKINADPRITEVGQFIRKTSIDELPQLINVLKGEMSMVGPRPHQSREVTFYKNEYQKLLHVKPGITGLAQISGRSDLNTAEEVNLDTYYIENWSIWLDFKILLRTPLALFNKRRVA